MKEFLKNDRTKFGIVLLALIICCFASNVLGGDDWTWLYAYDYDWLESMRMPNGRYLSNQLTYLMVRYVPVRFVIYVPVLFLMAWMLCSALRDKCKPVLMWTGLMLFCLMPAFEWNENIMWVSAFPVYSLPLIFVLVYLKLWYSEIGGKAQTSKLLPVGTLLIGVAGALCVEHMTLYCCLLSVFVLLYAKFKKDQKIRAYQVTYFIGTVLGTVLMFTNHNYYSIYDDGDHVGARSFEFGVSDVFYQMYHNVIPRFAKQFPLIHCLIALAFLVMLAKADRSAWKPERKRYVKLTILCEIIYAFYAVFVNCCTDLENLTPMMRVAAVEAALVFLHLVSIVYLAWVLMPRSRFIRVTLYTVSAFLTSAVFCVVNPATGRCFFSDFCFWLLCALELFDYAVELLPKAEPYAKKALCVTACAAVCLMSYINIVNKVAFNAAISYLKEQRESGLKQLGVIEPPYPEYTPGSTLVDILKKVSLHDSSEQFSTIMQWYVTCLEEYYGIDIDYEEFSCYTVSYYMTSL